MLYSVKYNGVVCYNKIVSIPSTNASHDILTYRSLTQDKLSLSQHPLAEDISMVRDARNDVNGLENYGNRK